MRQWLVAVVFAGVAAVPSSYVCAGQAPAEQPAEEMPRPSPLAKYCADRWKDFSDIFNLKLALGDAGSILFHARLTRLAQIGAGRFAGTKMGFEGPSSGIYGEGRVEYGISVFYWAWIGRKYADAGVSEDAVKTNRFFGRVDDIKAGQTYREFYDANRPWHKIGVAFSVPFLPGIEAEMSPAETVDFLLSLFDVRGLRVPPPFYKVEAHGEKVPAPESIRWHGQEDFEQYD